MPEHECLDFYHWVWLGVFNEFIENDETWGSLMETKSKLYESV